jgi:hypothetical protein
MEKYGFADPAAGAELITKRRSARQAIVISARDHLERWFEIYSWAGKVTPTEFKEKIFAAYEIYRPRRFGIEANGMQVLFGSLLRKEAENLFVEKPKFIPIYQPTKVTKQFRIRTGLEPVINEGRLFLQSKISPLALEIGGFPTGDTVDLVDCLETIISRVAPKFQNVHVRDQNVERYAAYLRATGCPGHLLEAKIEQFRKEQQL